MRFNPIAIHLLLSAYKQIRGKGDNSRNLHTVRHKNSQFGIAKRARDKESERAREGQKKRKSDRK